MKRIITEDYYQDGKIKMRAEGHETTWWYPNGNIEHRVQYNQQGEIDGICEWFWENGNKQSSAIYRNGKVIGEVKMWNKYGSEIGAKKEIKLRKKEPQKGHKRGI